MRTGVMLVVLGLVACKGGGGGGGPKDAPEGDAAVDTPAAVDAGVDAVSLPAGAPPIGACRHEWCWVSPLPQGNRLTAIWGSAANDVWVVAERETLLHYTSTGWTEYVMNAAMVWGTAANDVWAIGPSNVWRWNGTAWSVSLASGGSLIGGTGPNDVWAVLTSGAKHWNGTAWSDRASPGGAVAIGGTAGSMMAVTSAGGIMKYIGTDWAVADAGTRPTNAAVIIDPTHIVIAQDGSVQFWNGSSWAVNSPPVTANWNEISARSFTDVFVTGIANGVLQRYHWNGAQWSSAADAGDTGTPFALWHDPQGTVWAATESAEVRLWNGSTWTSKVAGDNYVSSGWGTAESDIWLVSVVGHTTFRNRTTHWDGTSWSEVTFPFPAATYRPGRMWGSAPNNYWLAGGRRVSGGDWQRYLFHWNGTAWSSEGPFGLESSASGAGFEAVWGSAANDVYAVARAAVYHYDGTSWSPVAAVPGGSDVFGTSANDVYILRGTELWHWDGAAWSSKTTPVAVARGWANSATDIWLTGATSGAVHYDGAFFVNLPASGGIPLGSASEMYIVSDVIRNWPTGFGSTPTIVGPAFFTPMGGAWRAPSGRLYVAGGGLLVH